MGLLLAALAAFTLKYSSWGATISAANSNVKYSRKRLCNLFTQLTASLCQDSEVNVRSIFVLLGVLYQILYQFNRHAFLLFTSGPPRTRGFVDLHKWPRVKSVPVNKHTITQFTPGILAFSDQFSCHMLTYIGEHSCDGFKRGVAKNADWCLILYQTGCENVSAKARKLLILHISCSLKVSSLRIYEGSVYR